MTWLVGMRIALRALRVNKLRSILTMLGIIIGVGAVITMIAIGSGAQAQVEEQIKALGSNLIIIIPGSFTGGGVRMGAGSRSTLTEDDAIRIAARAAGNPGGGPHAARHRTGRVRRQQLVDRVLWRSRRSTSRCATGRSPPAGPSTQLM